MFRIETLSHLNVQPKLGKNQKMIGGRTGNVTGPHVHNESKTFTTEAQARACRYPWPCLYSRPRASILRAFLCKAGGRGRRTPALRGRTGLSPWEA